MKKLLFALVTMLCLTACHKGILDSISDLQSQYQDLDARVTRLENLCKEMNTNITALQTIVNVLQSNDYITNVTEIKKNGNVIGYTITFGKHEPITIYNGEDGKDGINGSNGQDCSTPILGVAKDTDGIYYWTLNGEWLLDGDGHKIRVTGEKGDKGDKGDTGATGAAGQDGQNGQNGTNGTNGVTPQLKIENDYWYISYDNGATWTQLGKAKGDKGDTGATGAAGSNGTNGQDGDSMFQSVTYDEHTVTFTLSDGTVLQVPIGVGGSNYHNNHEYVDLGLSVKWATCNIGASAPKMYGDYYAWGEVTIKSDYSWNTYLWCNGSSSKLTKYCTQSYNGNNGFADNITTLEEADDVAHMNWGGNWRIPTFAEWNELLTQCTWTWGVYEGFPGYYVTNTSSGNYIFLPAGGLGFGVGVNNKGISGYYLANSIRSNSSASADGIDFSSSNVRSYLYDRCRGFSVRPICQ